MAKAPTVQDFFKRFPTDEACLEHLMMLRFGNPLACSKCGNKGQFAKLKKLPAYACPICGNHIHPMVGTPFAKSHTPLQKWFYAMYLFTTTRHGVPAKELQRQLSVTYKTAWRMGHEIRKYMGKVDGDDPLGGHVEVDETWIGGRVRGKGRGPQPENKTVVMGMVERGGEVMTRTIERTTRAQVWPHIFQNVERGSRISTDGHPLYDTLDRHGYRHEAVAHSEGVYVRGDVHTNSIEGFWSQLKRSIRGTHVHVSAKHLPKYLAEFEYRYNMRHFPAAMLPRLLVSF